jgi:soluble lytic murein transglycosylase-like protein
MQVTAAAAIDVGGGDRFDLDENRALGRAYLVSLYRRYGNWPDAIAAYNWGPGNLDNWITGGRVADKLPLQVEQYRDRVLREASGESSAAGGRDRN